MQKPTDLDLHCWQRQDISGFSRARINECDHPACFICHILIEYVYNFFHSSNHSFKSHFVILKAHINKKAHGPWLTHLSEIATADMQMLCNIFTILSMQLMKGSPFWAVHGFEEECVVVFLLLFFTIMGYGSQWSMTVWASSQSVSTVG